MEEDQVFARKYRPQAFQDVVGQEHIVKIIKNSIKKDKLAQAYLFSGPRGIGKTTLTRLFAKGINCIDMQDEPCNKCKSCIEISSSSSMMRIIGIILC